MALRSNIARLTDIVEAIALVQAEIVGVTLEAFQGDRRKRWVVERGIEIISEASRRLSHELKARHLEIPWPKVAGIGNVLRHEYQQVSAPIIWTLIHKDLPTLEKVCREELAAEIARDAP